MPAHNDYALALRISVSHFPHTPASRPGRRNISFPWRGIAVRNWPEVICEPHQRIAVVNVANVTESDFVCTGLEGRGVRDERFVEPSGAHDNRRIPSRKVIPCFLQKSTGSPHFFLPGHACGQVDFPIDFCNTLTVCN